MECNPFPAGVIRLAITGYMTMVNMEERPGYPVSGQECLEFVFHRKCLNSNHPETFLMFSAVWEVCGRPGRSSSSTLSLPSLKRRCHSKAYVRLRSTFSQTNTKINIH
ncbi:hypothetical protein TNCV_1494191 [Trichonephila clavipes]|nr:hypothetical protein TNCV_1494191 [Trichonephila clavipes]